jgi:hypothetical protein
VGSLNAEVNAANLKYLLHALNVFVIEDREFTPGLASLVVKVIQEKMVVFYMWPSDVQSNAFMPLTNLVRYYGTIDGDQKVRRALHFGGSPLVAVRCFCPNFFFFVTSAGRCS